MTNTPPTDTTPGSDDVESLLAAIRITLRHVRHLEKLMMGLTAFILITFIAVIVCIACTLL